MKFTEFLTQRHNTPNRFAALPEVSLDTLYQNSGHQAKLLSGLGTDGTLISCIMNPMTSIPLQVLLLEAAIYYTTENFYNLLDQFAAAQHLGKPGYYFNMIIALKGINDFCNNAAMRCDYMCWLCHNPLSVIEKEFAVPFTTASITQIADYPLPSYRNSEELNLAATEAVEIVNTTTPTAEHMRAAVQSIISKHIQDLLQKFGYARRYAEFDLLQRTAALELDQLSPHGEWRLIINQLTPQQMQNTADNQTKGKYQTFITAVQAAIDAAIIPGARNGLQMMSVIRIAQTKCQQQSKLMQDREDALITADRERLEREYAASLAPATPVPAATQPKRRQSILRMFAPRMSGTTSDLSTATNQAPPNHPNPGRCVCM